VESFEHAANAGIQQLVGGNGIDVLAVYLPIHPTEDIEASQKALRAVVDRRSQEQNRDDEQ
ncbi:MAG: hypothetical protein RRA94_10120, partial [Bacteroidota bacterium]|nr:hypothetical protein [Bacteroidota bacterium]